jgi:hypothetical protein
MRNKGLDLRHHSFGRAMRGLDETEVLSFLQATAPDYEQAHAEVASLRQQLDEAAVELRRLQEQERTVTRLLVAAEEDARTRLEATAKEVAEIDRKAEERARALVANAETQHARMQDEVRGIVARRSIAASGLTELIDALSRRAGQERPKPAAVAPPAPTPVRILQQAPAGPPPAVQPAPAIKPQLVVTTAPPAAPAIDPPTPVPALPTEPISLLGLSARDAATADADESESAATPDVSPSTDVVDSAPDAVEDDDAPRSRRAWWVAAAGIVLAVTTAAALGFPRIGGVTDEPPPPRSKPAAPAPTPKPVASEATESRPPAPAVVAAPVISAAPLAVTLKANRQCWLRLVVDGRTETKTLAEGEELSRSASREIELRVGDAAAIAVTVNGRTLAPLGRSGQVIDTVFHADLTSPH